MSVFPGPLHSAFSGFPDKTWLLGGVILSWCLGGFCWLGFSLVPPLPLMFD